MKQKKRDETSKSQNPRLDSSFALVLKTQPSAERSRRRQRPKGGEGAGVGFYGFSAAPGERVPRWGSCPGIPLPGVLTRVGAAACFWEVGTALCCCAIPTCKQLLTNTFGYTPTSGNSTRACALCHTCHPGWGKPRQQWMGSGLGI